MRPHYGIKSEQVNAASKSHQKRDRKAAISCIDSAPKKPCCDGGLSNWLRKTITTPLWLLWHDERLYRELQQAVCADDDQTVRALIQLGISPNGYYECEVVKNNFLLEGIEKRRNKAVQALLKEGSIPRLADLAASFKYQTDDQTCTALLEKYIAYLSERTDHDARQRTDLLQLIIEKGTPDQICIVLKKLKLSPDTRCMGEIKADSPLTYALEYRKELAPFLVAQGVTIADRELLKVIRRGDVEALHFLLRNYAFMPYGHVPDDKTFNVTSVPYLNAVGSFVRKEQQLPLIERYSENAPLHKSLHDAPSHMIDALVIFGVDVNWQDRNGRTALWHNRHAVAALMRHGADVDQVDVMGNTLLQELSQEQHESVSAREALEKMLVYPRTKSLDVSREKASVFMALCCLKKSCSALPYQLRKRILEFAYDDGHEGQCIAIFSSWGKYIKEVPVEKIVGVIPSQQELLLCRRQEISPGNYGCLLDPEAIIREHTRQHLLFLRKLLTQKDKAGNQPWQYARQDILCLRSATSDEHDFEYHWRGRVEREYRYLIKNGFVKEN